MAFQRSAGLVTGVWCAIALAIGCAPRVALVPASEPQRAVEPAHGSAARGVDTAGTPAAASDPFAPEEVTVEYWMQKDDPSRPCPDANVGTDRCMLVSSEAVTSSVPRLGCGEERREATPEARSCDAPDCRRGRVCS